jgi:hypothetical protein
MDRSVEVMDRSVEASKNLAFGLSALKPCIIRRVKAWQPTPACGIGLQ